MIKKIIPINRNFFLNDAVVGDGNSNEEPSFYP